MLRVIITDERLQELSGVLQTNSSYNNIIYICGHEAIIPQMFNAIQETINEAKTLKMNQKKNLIISICLGSVDIIGLLSSGKRPVLYNSNKITAHGCQNRGKYSTQEVVEMVFIRLQRLKSALLAYDPNARVVLFKLPPTLLQGNVKLAIDCINGKIHRENRNDDRIHSCTNIPMNKNRKVTAPDYILTCSCAEQWLKVWSNVVAVIEADVANNRPVTQVATGSSSSNKRPFATSQQNDRRPVKRTCLEPIVSGKPKLQEPPVISLESGNTNSVIEIDCVAPKEQIKCPYKSSTTVLDPSHLPDVICTSQNIVQTIKRSRKSSSTSSRRKVTVLKDNFINRQSNIICTHPSSSSATAINVIPASVQTRKLPEKLCSTPRSIGVTIPVASTSSNPSSRAVQSRDSCQLLVDKYTQIFSGQIHEGQASTDISANVCVLAAVAGVSNETLSEDNALCDELLSIARQFNAHSNKGEQNVQIKLAPPAVRTVMKAVGKTLEFMENGNFSELATDILYTAVMNVKKLYLG